MGLKLVTANPQWQDPVLRLSRDGDTKSITVLETTVHPGVKLMSFFESMSQLINSLSPQQEGTVSEYYTVAPNLTEMMVTDEMIGPQRVRFRVVTSFQYLAFLDINPTDSQKWRDWQEIMHRYTDGLSLLCSYQSDQVPVAYIPGLLPEHGFSQACSEIDAIPTLITQSVHIDYSSVPWTDGDVTHDLRIAKVIVPAASVNNARRILGDSTLAIWGTRFTVIPVEELNGPFFVNNLRGHVYEQQYRMVVRCSGLPAWADPDAVYVSDEICGESLPAESYCIIKSLTG